MEPGYSEKPPQYEPPSAGYPPPAGGPGYPPAGGPPGYPPAGGPPGYPPPGAYPPPGQPPYGQPPPPAAGGQYPPPMTTSTTVVVAQPYGGAAPGANIRYMQSPALIVCQHCQATVTTSMEYEAGLLTWIIVGMLCLFGCWFGCCLIPLCIDATKDIEHRCPNCKNINGRFRHIS